MHRRNITRPRRRRLPSTSFPPGIIWGVHLNQPFIYRKSDWTTQTAIDLPLLVYQFKGCFCRAGGFRFTKKKITMRLVQRISEEIKHHLLQVRFEIDQQIATTHEVVARKRQATTDVLLSEGDCLRQRFRDAKPLIDTFKEPVATILRQI